MDSNLKAVLKGVSDLALAISQISQGSLLVVLPELPTLAVDAAAIMSAAPLIVSEYENLSDSDRADLLSFISSSENFPANLSVQDYLQKVLDAAVALSALVQVIKK
jgi:hypothetical protein